MVSIDVSTPQLKATQKWIEAYAAIDLGKINVVTSKNYKHQTLPKSIGLPEETKEEYIRRLTGTLPLFTKFEVRPTLDGRPRTRRLISTLSLRSTT